MTPSRSALVFRVAVALCVLVLVAVLAVRSVEPLGMDQGLFACFTRWIPRGWLPYRDIFDSKPPLLFYWYALAAAIPGDVVRAIWWLEAAWLAATLATAYALGSRLWGRTAGLAGAALLFIGLWSPGWGGFWSRAQAEEILALPMLGAAWLAIDGRSRAPRAVLAGALVGVCGLFKIPSMAFAGAWAVMYLSPSPSRDGARRIGWMAAGAAAPWLVAIAWFAAHGALGAFVDAAIVYPRTYAEVIAPPWSQVLSGFARDLVEHGTLPLAAAAIGLVAMIRDGAAELRWIATWIALTLIAVVAQKQLAGYHFLVAMPALAIAGGYAVHALLRDTSNDAGRVFGRAMLGLALLGVLFARAAVAWWEAYSPDLEHLRGRTDRAAYLRRIQQGAYSVATEDQAARYVREHTAPSEGLLVWGLSPGIYPLADRHPVTRFPFHKLFMTDAPLSRRWPGLDARRADFMARLRAEPPAYVLVGRGDANGFEPLDSMSSMMRFAELRDFLREGYAEETQIGRFVVLRRATKP